MMSTLAESIVGVVVGEAAAQSGRRAPSEGSYQQQQQQQQHNVGPLQSVYDSVVEFGQQALNVALKTLQYVLLFEALLVSAAVLYGALYWAVMPLRLHDKLLYFDYSIRNDVGGASATVDFWAQHSQWDPSPLTTVGRVQGKMLRAGQHYEVGLELEMPTSYTNRRVGVFMVHTTLLDDKDNVLATSARPAMLPHTSGLLKGVRMVFGWPLFLLGFRKEAETVFVPCMDFFEESALHPLTKAKVTVSSGRVQFYRASMHITPQLKGLPWLMHSWFYTTLAAGVMFMASLELMLVGFVYVFFFLGAEDENATSGSSGQQRRRSERREAIRAGVGRYNTAPPSGAPRGTIVQGNARGLVGTVTAVAEGLMGKNAGTNDMDVSNDQREVPPGVQAYQRGARYVVGHQRGRGRREVIAGGDAARDAPRPGRMPEESDAAAMASWAALQEGTIESNQDKLSDRMAEERDHGDGVEVTRAAVIQTDTSDSVAPTSIDEVSAADGEGRGLSVGSMLGMAGLRH